MRINIIKEIFKKEIKDIIRDKRTVFMMVAVPIILYPIIMIIMTSIASSYINTAQSRSIMIGFPGKPEQRIVETINDENSKRANSSKGTIEVISNVSDYEEQLKNGKIDAFIEKDDDKYNVYINSVADETGIKDDEINKIIDLNKSELSSEIIEKAGLDPEYVLNPVEYEKVDIASTTEKIGILRGQIIPFVLVVGVLFGSIYPAIDVIAGEKERGTLETLFSLPVSNRELVTGKYLAVSLSAVVTSLLNIISMGATILYIFATGIANSGELDIRGSTLDMTLPIIITVISIVMFSLVVSALSMCVCSFAKTFKEAQHYITPLMLAVMLPSYASMLPNVVLNNVTAMIPVVNISLMIKSVLSFKSDINAITTVMIINLLFVILSLLILSKIFDSEEILFGDKAKIRINENKLYGKIPNKREGIAIYIVSFFTLIYIGSPIQTYMGKAGLVISELILLAIPVLVSIYMKADIKRVFKIKKPKIKDFIRGIITWVLGFMLVSAVSMILLMMFPEQSRVLEGMNEVIRGNNIILQILLIAAVPAVCEEFLFRGFIMTSLMGEKPKNKRYIAAVIAITGILFGMMHISFIRIVPTAILGIVIGYNAYKSDSIYPAIFVHFINNALSVIAVNYAPALIMGII